MQVMFLRYRSQTSLLDIHFLLRLDWSHPLGGIHSRVDRHEHIGKGFIGVEAFRLLLNDKRFWGLPMCLETPKGPDLKEDQENLTLLRSLIIA